MMEWILPGVIQVLKIIAVVLPLFVAVGFMTWAERRVIAWAQRRQGPNVVGPFGLLQWVADAVKLIFKETILPSGSNRIVFLIAPMLTMALAVVAWAVMPIDPRFYIADINVGILYIFAISSLGVYGIIMAGWSSNSKYPFLGALRSAAQMVSYEVSLGLVIITVVIVSAVFTIDGTGTFSLLGLVEAQRNVWFFIPLFPMFIVFFISALAETNRTPFDLPEGESELVAGYFVEYSSMAFALFFLGEYANILLMSAMTATLFFGGYLAPPGLGWLLPEWLAQGSFIWFILKTMFFAFVFIWVRATVPRYRYDQLMRLGWKVFLPFSVVAVVFYAAVVMIWAGPAEIPGV